MYIYIYYDCTRDLSSRGGSSISTRKQEKESVIYISSIDDGLLK